MRVSSSDESNIERMKLEKLSQMAFRTKLSYWILSIIKVFFSLLARSLSSIFDRFNKFYLVVR